MKTKLKIIIPTIIAIAAVITAAFCISFTPNTSQNIEEMLSTAQKYLYEQNYEQAILEYEPIINLDPKNVDAYLGLAQAYTGIGDTEKAVEVLEKGFEMTGDERIKKRLNELIENTEAEELPQNTVDEAEEITATTVGSEITITETTSEESTDNIEEVIRAEAISIIELFDVYKPTAEPNSVVYYYLPSDDPNFSYKTGSLTKCIYNEAGNLSLTYETYYYSDIHIQTCSDEIIVQNLDKNSTEFYSYYCQNDMSEYKKICYGKCFLDTRFIMTANAQTGLEYSNFSGAYENCYTFENPYYSETIKIYVDDNNEVIDIIVETDWVVSEFKMENNNWINTYSTNSGYSIKYYPCIINELPEGASEDDFSVPTIDSETCRTFYDLNDYNNYISNYYSDNY